VIQAIEMNNAEIALAKLASGKTQNEKVRAFADMLIKDHMGALARLRSIPSITLTDTRLNARHQASVDRLSQISGIEFDREYMRVMVSEHQDAVKFFEQQSKADSSVPAPGNACLARVSQELTLKVREHLQEAQNILKDLELPFRANTNKNGKFQFQYHPGPYTEWGPLMSRAVREFVLRFPVHLPHWGSHMTRLHCGRAGTFISCSTSPGTRRPS
jgi:putative membrane protein